VDPARARALGATPAAQRFFDAAASGGGAPFSDAPGGTRADWAALFAGVPAAALAQPGCELAKSPLALLHGLCALFPPLLQRLPAAAPAYFNGLGAAALEDLFAAFAVYFSTADRALAAGAAAARAPDIVPLDGTGGTRSPFQALLAATPGALEAVLGGAPPPPAAVRAVEHAASVTLLLKGTPILGFEFWHVEFFGPGAELLPAPGTALSWGHVEVWPLWPEAAERACGDEEGEEVYDYNSD
jgi:hypothetical protein